MKITNAEKFLLALMIAGCLTTGALAADRITVDSGQTYGENNGTITDTFNELSGTEGGAINNAGTITFITGELSVDNDGNVTSTSSFTNNSSSGSGGAIYNSGTIDEISNTVFEGNSYTTSTSSVTGGGAIYNSGNIGEISNSMFTGNKATHTANYDGNGGAIYNSSTGKITTISDCTFTNNSASGGGAMYGGAIYNRGTITTISGCTFTGNSASDGTGYGGAIGNTGTISTIKNTSFYNNTAKSSGGAIYSTTSLTIAADGSEAGGDVVFSGNSANKGGAIYMSAANTTLKFSLSNKGTITLKDSIDGNSSGYSIEISGDGLDTTFYLLSEISNASSISVGNTTLSFVNDTIGDYSLNKFKLTDNIGMAVDVDLASETMDTISTTSFDANGYTISVTEMNILGETEKETVAIYFADTGLMKYVEQSSGLTVTAYSPIYKYSYDSNEVHYVYSEGGKIYYNGKSVGTTNASDLISGDGGYFVFGATEPLGAGGSKRYNPAVLASEVAQAGVYHAMNMMFDVSFEHSEYFMKLPQEVRLAQSEIAKAKKSARKVKENDPTKVAYYNRNELTDRGVWAKTFASNEKVSYGGGYDSRDKYYGAMIGFDSSLRDHGDGWASVFTGYVGTMGIRQEYEGGHIKQHGGFVGVTESFYKKNFYTAWTVAAGTTKANEHTMYGKDKERLDSYGIAARFGWNIDMDYNGKFALLPTFTASYSTVNPENFTNSADVKFTGSGFRAVQLNPNVKFIWKMNDGWQPYLTVGEIWTVGESSHVTATYSGTRNNLTALDLRAYTEYGAGVQKRWANDRDAYIQFLGHSDGRDGFLVNAGFRWNF